MPASTDTFRVHTRKMKMAGVLFLAHLHFPDLSSALGTVLFQFPGQVGGNFFVWRIRSFPCWVTNFAQSPGSLRNVSSEQVYYR